MKTKAIVAGLVALAAGLTTYYFYKEKKSQNSSTGSKDASSYRHIF